jgi:small GTP-binding protein
MIKEFKAIIIGNSGVGKTTFLKRLYNINSSCYNISSTIGFNIQKIQNYDISVNFWDTSGQEKYKSITKNYLRNSNIVFLVFDVNDYQTFLDIETFWLNESKKYVEEDTLFYLIANKKDLFKNHPIHRYNNFINENNLNFFFISALKDQEFNKIMNSMYSNLNKLEYKPKKKNILYSSFNKKNCCT